MELERIVNEIKREAGKEIESLKKDHRLELERIDREGEEKLKKLQKEEEKRLNEEKRKALSDYQKDKEFQLKMDLLKLKKILFSEAVLKVKRRAQEFPSFKKKEILGRKAESAKKNLENDCLIIFPYGKRDELSGIFKDFPSERIKEKEIGFNDGFLVESDKSVFKTSLNDLIDEATEKENVGLLFQK